MYKIINRVPENMHEKFICFFEPILLLRQSLYKKKITISFKILKEKINIIRRIIAIDVITLFKHHIIVADFYT